MSLRRFYVPGIIVISVSIAGWLVIPPPIAVQSSGLADVPWEMPKLFAFNAKDALATLTEASLWGKLADIPRASDVEPEWRFIGAMARGEERHVIIKKDNQMEQMLVPGDILPGGSKILSIENDRLCLLINGQKRSLYIYAQGPLGGDMSYVVKAENAINAGMKSLKPSKKPK